MAITKSTQRRNITIYTTSDGMTWDLESRANDHERYIQDARIYSELHSMKLEFPLFGNMLDGMWYLISNQEQIEYFTRKYLNPNSYRYLNENSKNVLQLGDWVAVQRDYSTTYDEWSEDGLLTLSYLLETMKKYISTAEEVTVDGKY